MNMQQQPREASPRVIESALALTPTGRGRSSAPRFHLWLPIITKVAAAAGAALILAVIGARAGAHNSPPPLAPAPSAAPPVAAAFIPPASPATTAVVPASAPAVPTPAGDDSGSAEPPPTTSPASGAGLLADGRVVLNAATEAELTKLPGIGPSRARAILALRQRLTRFRAVEDLLRIKGIGRKMLRRLRPSVVVDRPIDDRKPAPAAGTPASPAAEDSDVANR
jgi:competence protein ComEA